MTTKILNYFFSQTVMKYLICLFMFFHFAIIPIGAVQDTGDMPQTISTSELMARYKLTRTYDLQDGSQILKNRKIAVKLVPGMSRILINGIVRKTDYPNCYKKGHMMVDRKVLDFFSEIRKPKPAQKKTIKKLVVIDPGHGGKDSGARACGLQEKDIVLDVARELKKRLAKSGYRILMTRDSDNYLSLEDRADKANRAEADLFISIHANSTSGAIAEGIETFYLINRSYTFDKKRLMRASTKYKLSEISKNPVSASGRSIKRAVLSVLLQDARLNSKMLATEVQKSMIMNLREVNRGIKPANWSVLRNSVFPAILVEVGFINNPITASKFNKSSYRKKIAESIVVGIRKYFSIKAQLGYEY